MKRFIRVYGSVRHPAFKDQILKSTETGIEYRYRPYYFQKVPNIVLWVLFLKSICTIIVGTLKVPNAQFFE